VQNANESFGVADAVPGTWEEIAGPRRPIRVLRPLIGFPFRQNKGLNDKSQFLGATHQPCSFHAWGYQGSLVLNGCGSSLAEPGDCGLPNICPSARVGIRMTSARSPTNALSFSPLLHPCKDSHVPRWGPPLHAFYSIKCSSSRTFTPWAGFSPVFYRFYK